MLEEKFFVDRIEILEDGQIQVRRTTVILRDGIEISRTYHRHVLEPGALLDGEDMRVITIAKAIWTSDVIRKFQNNIKFSQIDFKN